VDLLRAQAALLALEQREHLLARAAGAVPGAGELAARVLAPALGMRVRIGRHTLDPSVPTANENGLQ
jgi:hypothetical protein